ncbi:endonuclease/exonuclease/phosphatase family protein [Shigella flexneri]
MKFVSFNINGLRARPHQLAAIVEKHQPDVIGLQETKVHDDMFPLEEVAKARLQRLLSRPERPLGVALLTKETPIAVRRGFPAMTKKRSVVSSWQKFGPSGQHHCDQRLFPAGRKPRP